MPSRRILRTRDAITDLDEIWDYIARDSPAAADRMLDERDNGFVLLANTPDIGALQEKLADGTYRRFHNS